MAGTIIIPVKPFHEGKTRLASILTPEQRKRLSRDFFQHVLTLAKDRTLNAEVLVVSRCQEALEMARKAGARSMIERGQGQNSALEQAMGRVNGSVLLLSSDLPFLITEDLAVMLALGETVDVGIATDKARTGTNALFLGQPRLIRPCFGPDSRALHEAEADGAGLRWTVIERIGLAHDVDRPEDLLFLNNRSC